MGELHDDGRSKARGRLARPLAVLLTLIATALFVGALLGRDARSTVNGVRMAHEGESSWLSPHPPPVWPPGAPIVRRAEALWPDWTQVYARRVSPFARRSSARAASAHRLSSPVYTASEAFEIWTTLAAVTAAMVALALMAVGRPRGAGGLPTVLGRDVVALGLVLAATCVDVAIAGPLTTVSPALLACALVVEAIRRDPRLRVAAMVPGLFLAGSLLLVTAEVLVSSWIDAVARAAVFAALALLATGALVAPPLRSEEETPPRRALRRCRLDVPQLLSITLGIALVSALIARVELVPHFDVTDSGWRLSLVGGFAAALLAGLCVHVASPLEDGRRIPPAAAFALTFGAAFHASFFVAGRWTASETTLGTGFLVMAGLTHLVLLVAAGGRLAFAIRRVRLESA